MVLATLLALFLVVLLLAVLIGVLLYAVTLPLFVQLWVLDPFGDPSVVFPVWVLLLGVVSSLVVYLGGGAAPVKDRVIGLLCVCLSAAGAYFFADSWRLLEMQHEYYISQPESILGDPGSLCYDFVTACMLWGNTSPYPDQGLVMSISALLFYIGAFGWYVTVTGSPVTEVLDGWIGSIESGSEDRSDSDVIMWHKRK